MKIESLSLSALGLLPGLAEADGRKRAEAAALAGCSRAGGEDREVQAWTCAQP